MISTSNKTLQTMKPYVRKWVTLSASWGDGEGSADIRMSRRQWKKILEGEPYSDSKCYWTEEGRGTSYWDFNAIEPGSVLITYHDGGVAIDGTVEDISVSLPE